VITSWKEFGYNKNIINVLLNHRNRLYCLFCLRQQRCTAALI